MTEWVEALTVEAWRPGFNPWDPCKGGRREPTAQICPLTPHRLCDMCAHTNNSNNKPDKDTVQESQARFTALHSQQFDLGHCT